MHLVAIGETDKFQKFIIICNQLNALAGLQLGMTHGIGPRHGASPILMAPLALITISRIRGWLGVTGTPGPFA